MGNLLILALLLSPYDVAMMNEAKRTCAKDPELVEYLFRIELEEGVPVGARGLLAGAVFQEASCKRDIHCGDSGKSCGVVQFRGWAFPGIRGVQKELRRAGRVTPRGDARDDWEASARYWVRHFLRQLSKTRAHCKTGQIFSAANATAVRAAKCVEWKKRRGKRICVKRVPRCEGVTLHWKRRQQWHDAVVARMAPESPLDVAQRQALASGCAEGQKPQKAKD